LVSIAVLFLYVDVRVCECVLYACVRGHVWCCFYAHAWNWNFQRGTL